METRKSNFFRVNLPYGLRQNENNEWQLFNREYENLGTPIKKISEKLLLSVAMPHKKYKPDGKLQEVWLYDDATNPQYDPKHWNTYFAKLKKLNKILIEIEDVRYYTGNGTTVQKA